MNEGRGGVLSRRGGGLGLAARGGECAVVVSKVVGGRLVAHPGAGRSTGWTPVGEAAELEEGVEDTHT